MSLRATLMGVVRQDVNKSAGSSGDMGRSRLAAHAASCIQFLKNMTCNEEYLLLLISLSNSFLRQNRVFPEKSLNRSSIFLEFSNCVLKLANASLPWPIWPWLNLKESNFHQNLFTSTIINHSNTYLLWLNRSHTHNRS